MPEILRAGRLFEVDLDALRALGVRALLLDADNTLCFWHSLQIPDETLLWLRQAKAMGFALAVVSNARTRRLQPLAARLGLPIFHRAMKPLPFALLRAAKALGMPPKHCAMLGDQLLTDLPAALLCGMRRVLVEPLDRKRESAFTKGFSRRAEWLLGRRP
ncbi:MAG: YqeG family HAD IIIA-type phosphatase [Christensenellaceae bacterium]|jgi:HAD superfamily phosphatase (TIGR01668 family)|nr:YqeG family HAD IIIA-type phosphatase [Christensenellaceae bacterium]